MGFMAILPFLFVTIWAGIEQVDREKNADLYKEEDDGHDDIS